MAFKGVDYMALDDELSSEEKMTRDTVRRFVDEQVLPVIEEAYLEGRFPEEIIPGLAELGVLGANLPEEYGCAGMNNVAYGLIMQELERGDSGVRSFVSVQGALVMYPIFTFGSEEQKRRWLPAMAKAEAIGCFGLTEADHGSDPGGMKTRAVKDGSGWVLNGSKMWITNGSMADVAVVWAKTDDGIRGFLVEKGTPGYEAKQMHGKHSLRASDTSELVLNDVRLPGDAILPGSGGLKSPLMCLTQARYGIAWGVVGCAMACYDEALRYSKGLASIEDLGSMTVLCTDKTGTLTAGAASLAAAVDARGVVSPRVLELAVTNARLQTGLANPLDEVLIAAPAGAGTVACEKVDELPYDFLRKRMSIAVRHAARDDYEVITKGAAASIIAICSCIRLPTGLQDSDAGNRAALLALQEQYASQGQRVLAVASKRSTLPVADETAMTFEGFLLFEDPPKPGIAATIDELRSLGVQLKIITGDNRHTARHVAQVVGMATPRMLAGAQLQQLSDEALWHQAEHTDVFAEVDPNQKERIILALRKVGHVVGYLGDGINDAPALQAADVGISVDGAVDVAREAADIVLLQHDLAVINAGVRQGRTTFLNTQKYILSTTSANFGNMLSMACASAFLPFLPLTAAQILLNNLLSDIPALSLANDQVDSGLLKRPTRWSMQRIRNFTIVFGLVSTLFDMLAFATLMYLGDGLAAPFRTGWFLESLATEVLVLFMIRTPGLFCRDKPGAAMICSSVIVLLAAILAIQTPLGQWMGFVPLPAGMLLALAAITVAYAATVEWLKSRLYRLGDGEAGRIAP